MCVKERQKQECFLLFRAVREQKPSFSLPSFLCLSTCYHLTCWPLKLTREQGCLILGQTVPIKGYMPSEPILSPTYYYKAEGSWRFTWQLSLVEVLQFPLFSGLVDQKLTHKVFTGKTFNMEHTVRSIVFPVAKFVGYKFLLNLFLLNKLWNLWNNPWIIIIIHGCLLFIFYNKDLVNSIIYYNSCRILSELDFFFPLEKTEQIVNI